MKYTSFYNAFNFAPILVALILVFGTQIFRQLSHNKITRIGAVAKLLKVDTRIVRQKIKHQLNR
ncbi:hypothetical protein FD20_GL002050 [Liquorilactobacillus uvarum DSM 19971]|jgi:hypothetical protein|uniref:Uncharacterized protein n=1 Tax=Liquorilactobacillus uvarum DSM 19971 TaxID=1423812 RepID=A0A0R1PTI3_9LACO|nr:hypothetical protein FD20_GL002050 [Liquorilactobacillus uvarum DSM 19971]